MFPFPPFLWFWEDGDQVATTTFTVAQPLAHVLCELPGSNQPLSPWVCRASQLSSSQPLSLWACTAQITLGASSPLLKISSQSSCPRFLTSTQLFTQLNFLTVLDTSGPGSKWPISSPFSRCCPAPQFLWCWHPQSQWLYTDSVSPTSSLFPPGTSSIQVPPCAGLPSLLW